MVAHQRQRGSEVIQRSIQERVDGTGQVKKQLIPLNIVDPQNNRRRNNNKPESITMDKNAPQFPKLIPAFLGQKNMIITHLFSRLVSRSSVSQLVEIPPHSPPRRCRVTRSGHASRSDLCALAARLAVDRQSCSGFTSQDRRRHTRLRCRTCVHFEYGLKR